MDHGAENRTHFAALSFEIEMQSSYSSSLSLREKLHKESIVNDAGRLTKKPFQTTLLRFTDWRYYKELVFLWPCELKFTNDTENTCESDD
jgi:hypothetical protein